MSVNTFEGTVENGQIKLSGDVVLPERSRVYVLVPDAHETLATPKQIHSPRLSDPSKMSEFRKEVVKADDHGNV